MQQTQEFLRLFDGRGGRHFEPWKRCNIALPPIVKSKNGRREIDSMQFGHVEIRWSHGRFNKQPEAKVYLDSTLATTPGYVLL